MVVAALESMLVAAPLLSNVDMYQVCLKILSIHPALCCICADINTQYDLAEITRQVLVNAHITLYYALIDAYNAGDLAGVQVSFVYLRSVNFHRVTRAQFYR